jgi:DNA-directed RNA polymerase alpha subunit
VRRILKCKQACSILKKNQHVIFSSQHDKKIDLTLKVYATEHYIEDRQKKGKMVHPM